MTKERKKHEIYMEKQKRYNGSMERVGESLTAEAAAVTYSFCFRSLASTQRMKLRALGY